MVHNANPAQSLTLPASFAARETGSRVELPLAMVSTRPNPMEQPLLAPYLAGESFEAVETYTFSTARRDLEAFREGRVLHIERTRLEFSRVGPWIPFMRWGQRGGNLEYRLVGEKSDDPRSLPRELRSELRERVPLYLEAPSCRLARRAENLWVQFATHFDAYLAGERFPLPAPVTAEACDPAWDAPTPPRP